jgi:hypothetical protein
VNKKFLRLILFGALLGSILGGQLSLTSPSQAKSGVEEFSQSEPAAASADFVYYLPTIKSDSLLVQGTTAFGIDMGDITPENGLYRMKNAGAAWIRRSEVNWSKVEPTQGDRNWNALSKLDQDLIRASSNGMEVILIVLGTPPWAQKANGYYCGPVKSTKLAAFADFMNDLVTRYSAPPYNVKYWELWNEPDVTPWPGGQNSEFGCWGANDDYYGGGYYAEMLKAAYPAIKSADPEAQVLVGGLLLDCNPTITDCGNKQPMFLEGILRHNGANDGGDYFDGISFHAYDYYWDQLGKYGSPKWGSSYGTGPVVLAKAQFIQNLLNNPEFGAPGKFLINTETAVVCGKHGDEPGIGTCDASPTSAYETTKAYYIPQVFAAGEAAGLRASIWYSSFGWRNSGLLSEGDLAKRPAYQAYFVARNQLLDSTYVREIEEFSSVMGYEFSRPDRRVWLIWSTDAQEHEVELGSSPLKIYDALGAGVPSSDTISVGAKPLYLIWAP